eukprot:351135-Chlamydomonas_euryale.AAC.4
MRRSKSGGKSRVARGQLCATSSGTFTKAAVSCRHACQEASACPRLRPRVEGTADVEPTVRACRWMQGEHKRELRRVEATQLAKPYTLAPVQAEHGMPRCYSYSPTQPTMLHYSEAQGRCAPCTAGPQQH